MIRRRLRLLPGILAATCVLTGRGAAQTPEDSAAEPALVEVQLGRIAGQTMQIFRAGSDVLIPVAAFFDLAEVRYQAIPSGGLAATLQPSGLVVIIDPAGDTLTLGRQRIALDPAQRRRLDNELYLSSNVLGRLLAIEFVTNWSDLEIAVLDPGPLPIAKRLAREAARRNRLGQEGLEPELALGLERRRWNGLALDYSVLAPSQDPIHNGALATSMGLDVLGGSFELGVSALGQGQSRTDASWSGVWRTSRWVTQLRLGDAFATGPHPRTVRGFSITNAPFLRPAILGDATFAGRLGPGWQIEAYRGGRLIAFDSVNALGQFSIDAPIQYGENPVDFVAYGPFGEIREFQRTYRVITDVLPSRRFEYGAALGACRTSECQSSANLDLRYGITPRLTMGSGMELFRRDSLPDLFHPYLSLSGSFANAWGVELEGVSKAVLRGGLRFEPSTDLSLSAEYNHFARGTVAPILTPAGRLEQFTLQGFVRPLVTSTLYLSGSLDRVRSLSGDNTSARVGASVQVAGVRLLPSLRIERDVPVAAASRLQGFYGINSYILPQPALGRFFGAFTGRTTLEMRGSFEPSTVSGFISRLLTPGLRMETGVAWTRGGLGPTYTFSLSTELRSVRAYATMNAPSGGTATSTQFVQGSVLYNPSSRKLDFTAGPSMQRAGIAGRVFLDENGNGQWDTGEQLIPGVRVRVGMENAVSDSSGQYRVWDLSPYEPVLVVIDSLSLPSPLWTPRFATVSVEPGPNRFRTLDIPIAPGGTIEGHVVRETVAGLQGLGGTPLVLTDLATGSTRSIVTFSDGAFYALGVKPGEYEIRVDPRVESRLGMKAAPRRFVLQSLVDGAEVGGIELKLVPEK